MPPCNYLAAHQSTDFYFWTLGLVVIRTWFNLIRMNILWQLTNPHNRLMVGT